MFYAVTEKYPLECVFVYKFVSPLFATSLSHFRVNMSLCLL